jgi:hypothetical protein
MFLHILGMFRHQYIMVPTLLSLWSLDTGMWEEGTNSKQLIACMCDVTGPVKEI